MNIHCVIGTVMKKPQLVTAENKAPFLYFELAESTKKSPHGRNQWKIIKYDAAEALTKLEDELKPGELLFISGAGFFNALGHYHIAAKELLMLNIKMDVPKSDEMKDLCDFLNEVMMQEGD